MDPTNTDPSKATPPTWQFGVGAWLDNGGYHVRFGDIEGTSNSDHDQAE